MKLLRIFSRLLVGVVFVFSGFVKAVDPLGSTYKFIDYFNAFEIGFLEPMALPMAILLSTIEITLGISLLLGYRMRFSSWLLLIFMSFFTILTLILALTNPVQDCGCFGDALILTNWETFWKNVVIMVFTIIIFISRKKYDPIRSALKEWSVLIGFFAAVVLLSVYCYNNLPLLDFRPYHVGNYIPGDMIIPEGAPKSEFETVLVYRNLETGEENEFTMENFPRDTMKWEFVDAVTTQISQGYEPPIHDFNIIAPDGGEITEDIIREEDFTFLLVSYDAMQAPPDALQDANKYFRLSQTAEDISFFAVSSTLREDLDSLSLILNLEYDFSQADEITLKTIIRSNPGLLLIKNGTIMAKWHYDNFPGNKKFNEYREVFEGFPFCPGCDLRLISQAPLGSRADEYETILFYRNLEEDTISEFTVDNFPRETDVWIFENSVTKKVRSGFQDPVSLIEIESVYGMDFSEIAFMNEEYSLLFFISDPSELSDDQFRALNKLGGMAMEYLPGRVDVFAVTSLDDQQILDFTRDNISPFEYFSGRPDQIERFAGDSIRVVLVKNSKVIYNWKGLNVPNPSVLGEIEDEELREAETVFTPLILSEKNRQDEKRMVYIFILGFFFIAMVLRFYFNLKEPDA